MVAKVLAVANQKGGVGKTTTTLSLGAALYRMGKKVLVLDLDPHACASIHLAFYPENLGSTVYDVFQAGPGEWTDIWKKVIHSGEEGSGFDFAAGSIRLSELETDLKSRPGRGAILTGALKELREDYD
ncbi:MAG: AAA family ATPase, partial [Thermodesulfobacteriota bacterium]|nr:AAA family ATPase [Thermodesulfobacteriota bacterium]